MAAPMRGGTRRESVPKIPPCGQRWSSAAMFRHVFHESTGGRHTPQPAVTSYRLTAPQGVTASGRLMAYIGDDGSVNNTERPVFNVVSVPDSADPRLFVELSSYGRDLVEGSSCPPNPEFFHGH